MWWSMSYFDSYKHYGLRGPPPGPGSEVEYLDNAKVLKRYVKMTARIFANSLSPGGNQEIIQIMSKADLEGIYKSLEEFFDN